MSSKKAWRDINWKLVEGRVFRLQKRIFSASLEGNTRKVHYLQRKVMGSLDSKLLSVRRVTQRKKGRNTEGVDRVKSLTPIKKLKLAYDLKVGTSAAQIRRAWIPKPGKSELRPLGILTIRDRALQQLVRLALEPEWEAKFEWGSYGFRPGRSCQDAIQDIFINLRGRHRYVLDADIRKCFDKISHSKLLDKLSSCKLIRTQVRQWLEAGVMEEYAKAGQTDWHTVDVNPAGTPQGGIISPLLANIALHGLGDALKQRYVDKYYKGTARESINRRKQNLAFVRYADDFVVLHDNEYVITALKSYASDWLKENLDLSLSEEKTKIRSTSEGFEYLGFQIITINKSDGKTKCKITPSKSSKKRFLNKTREVITKNRPVSAHVLIFLLAPIIVGWCRYYRSHECTVAFKQVEYSLFGQLRAWTFRRRSKGLRSRTAIKEKYFPDKTTVVFNGRKHSGSWILVGTHPSRTGPKTVFLPYPSWVRTKKHVKIKEGHSPFDGDSIYWTQRNERFSKWTGRTSKLMVKQKMICPLCDGKFLNEHIIEVDHIKPVSLGGNDRFENLQAVHDSCHAQKSARELKFTRR
jgi:RNA-directed DNA polymerase